MKEIKAIHDKAMDRAEFAAIARLRGDEDGFARMIREAWALERNAAYHPDLQADLEPTRSVLHRSAAALAIECGEYREAERLIARALVGNPPDEIANELRDLLEDVYFKRHLNLRGVSLGDEEIQLSISGRSVGFGIAPSEEYVERVQTFSKLVYRTAERKMGMDYRERGSPERDVKDEFEVFVSVPRAASLAVTLKIGRTKAQQVLHFGDDVRVKDVLDEITVCLSALDAGNHRMVEEIIRDPVYFTNFVGLAKKIAPDGEDVSQVGFTIVRDGKAREVSFTRTRSEMSARGRGLNSGNLASDVRAIPKVAQSPLSVEIRGKLIAADSRGDQLGTLIVREENGAESIVLVPVGMMSDIVKPLYELDVIVQGVGGDDGLILEDISRVRARATP